MTIDNAREVIRISLRVPEGQNISMFKRLTGCDGAFTMTPLVNPVTGQKHEHLYVDSVTENEMRRIPEPLYPFLAICIRAYCKMLKGAPE